MTQTAVVLELLQQYANEWVPGNRLVEVGSGWRYGDIIFRLRKRGHNIDTRPDPEGRSAVHQYRLVDARPTAGQVTLPWNLSTIEMRRTLTNARESESPGAEPRSASGDQPLLEGTTPTGRD